MKLLIWGLAAFFCCALPLWACAGDDKEGPEVKTVTVTELKAIADADSSVLLIDVRRPEEYEAVHAVPVKRLIDYTQIADSAANLPAKRDTAIYLICRTGRRSGIAARDLMKLGYTNVFNVEGGTNAWVKEDFPTASGPGILSDSNPEPAPEESR